MNDSERAELDAAMARLADGDRDAFAPVFATLRPQVGRLCERMLGLAAGLALTGLPVPARPGGTGPSPPAGSSGRRAKQGGRH